jgi:hypothetical protein
MTPREPNFFDICASFGLDLIHPILARKYIQQLLVPQLELAPSWLIPGVRKEFGSMFVKRESVPEGLDHVIRGREGKGPRYQADRCHRIPTIATGQILFGLDERETHQTPRKSMLTLLWFEETFISWRGLLRARRTSRTPSWTHLIVSSLHRPFVDTFGKRMTPALHYQVAASQPTKESQINTTVSLLD